MLEAPIDSVKDRKAMLDRLRPLAAAALAQLQKHYDVELTYASNAIEGNTLTLRETAEVIEHGLTVGGKPLRDHLEALDHYDALLWMRELAVATRPIDESVVCELHRRIVARSQPAIAGVYSRNPRRIAGSPVVFPNPAKIPGLMEELG
ncbi:MAG TPA: Fic family protein, partial [Methylosinus sp.]